MLPTRARERAIGRDVGDACGDALARAESSHVGSVDLDRAPLRDGEAGERVFQLDLAVAVDPGHSEYFSGVDRQSLDREATEP